MDIVPDEAEGGAVDLRDEADTAPAPQDDPPPVLRAAVAPLRDRIVDVVQEGVRGGLKGVGWARLGEFLTESETGHALRQWFGEHPALDTPYDRDRLLRAIDREIAWIDGMMREQLDACLHHPRFQRLESVWRGVGFLVNHSDGMDGVKIKTLNLSWAELCRDLERAIEFDQSNLFNLIYNQEFGMPGGEPYGVLIGDYEVWHRRGQGHPTDDVAALKAMSQIAAAAFAPFVTGCSPVMLGIDRFRDMGVPIDFSDQFNQPDYVRWRSFQETEDSRFVGLALPRVLMRLPYEDDGSRVDGFRYWEDVSDPTGENYLWGTAVFAFASVLIRAYDNFGWFADIRGVRRDEISGGLVVGLPVQSFGTDKDGIAIKYSTDVSVSERQEKELSDLGLIPLSKSKDTEYSVFYSNQSAQRPKRYSSMAADVNARMSAMLQYMFCVGRFAHYVKVIGRDRVGSYATPEECQSYLRNWLMEYTNADDDASNEQKAKYPLREADVEVRENPGNPGIFNCTIHLRPHFQLDQVISSFKLVTEVAAQEGS